MSIIDDALKGVERAQSQDEHESAVANRPARQAVHRVPRALVFGLLVVVVLIGGWLVSSMLGLTGQSYHSQPVVAETDIDDSDWVRPQEMGTAEKVDRSSTPGEGSELELAITDPDGDAPANEVADLTDSVVGEKGEVNEVSQLTEGGQPVSASRLAAGAGDEVSQLTATASRVAVPESVAEPTEGPDGLAESGEVLSAPDRETAASSVLAALADSETAAPGVATVGRVVTGKGSAATDPPGESVASLTAVDEADPAISREIGGMDGRSVAELTETANNGVNAALSRVTNDAQKGSGADLNNPVRAESASSKKTASLAGGATVSSSLNQPGLTQVPVVEAINAAKAAEARGDYSAALAALASSNSDDRDLSLYRARLLARLGRFEESGDLASGFNEGSLDASDSFWLGYVRFNLAQWQPAVRALSRAVQLNTSDPLAALYLGMAQQQSGDYLGSIDAFHQARQLRPDMPEIAFNTGISWWALGERERALGAFRHFLRITDGQRQTYAEQRRRVAKSYLGNR